MKKIIAFIAIVLVVLVTICAAIEDIPQAQLSNGVLEAQLYLPDKETGYYRGTRFDWSGVVAGLTYKNHSYFGKWFEKYSPTFHDAIMGPVDEYNPVGYADAKIGGKFLKIGVGMLEKPEEKNYSFSNIYSIVNGGTWKTKKRKDRIEYNHKLIDDNYSYDYTKVLQLIPGQPDMVIRHKFTNTGKNLIETDVYNHNFFVIDSQTTGPQFTVSFPFKPVGEPTGAVKPGKIQNNAIVFDKIFTPKDHLFYPGLTGYGTNESDYLIRIENKETGAGVKIDGDKPLSKLVFWSAVKTVCPEPYIHLKVEPGQSFSWDIKYTFYTF